jgi:hypothetical protein
VHLGSASDGGIDHHGPGPRRRRLPQSHDFSWDGRKGFTVERNREWHRAGGWNAAYVTDHMAFEGAILGMAANPRRAGDGTTLLPAVECRRRGTHLLVLGLTSADVARLNTEPPDGRAPLPYDPGHAVIQAIPATLAKVETRGGRRTRVSDLVGIELSDGSPHGLDQGQRERVPLLAIAERRNLALVSGSNNHGWTYAPVAWSLLRIAAWRELTPDALDSRIRELLRREKLHAVTVVERYAPIPVQRAWDSPPRCRRLPGACWRRSRRRSVYRGWRGCGAGTRGVVSPTSPTGRTHGARCPRMKFQSLNSEGPALLQGPFMVKILR